LIVKDFLLNNTLNLRNASRDLRNKKSLPHRWLNRPLCQHLENQGPGVNQELQALQAHLDQRESLAEMALRVWTVFKVLLETW